MATQNPNLIMDRGFPSSYDRSIGGKVTATLEKLIRDRTSSGLHVEPIQNCADDRVRTAKVDQFHRLVFFDLGSWLLLYGVYGHDRAYQVATTAYARVNPTSGAAEIREAEPSGATGGGRYTDSEVQALAEARAAEMVAASQAQADATPAPEALPTPESNPLDRFSARELVNQLGIDEPVARYAVGAATEEQLLSFLERVGGWQGDALMDLAAGTSMDEVCASYALSDATGGTSVGTPSETEAVVRAATDQRAASQFHLIEDDEALEKALANGDFEAWRLFLHPDQREYVQKTASGPFRLSGGAGTGKTVVLVHRAVRLAKQNPRARTLVVSYTANLVTMIREQIRALDPEVRIAERVGQPGISVQTLDQVARRILNDASGTAEFTSAMESVLGWGVRRMPDYRGSGSFGSSPWDEAIDDAGADLPENLRSAPFFVSEYQEIILPGRISQEIEYVRAPRPGRGTRLGRKQRQIVWRVIAQYRKNGLAAQQIDWDEAATVAASLQEQEGMTGLADHLLIDEGQDFTPTRWQLARAVVPEGPDDLFIAEDSNQRIYGNRIVLGRYGIRIVGRSRRLRLNYRTTEQNLHLALQVLENASYDVDDAEEGQESASRVEDRYISSRSGPRPLLLRADDLGQEFDQAAELLTTWIGQIKDSGLRANTLGVLTRTKKMRDGFVRAMDERGVHVAPVDGRDALPSAPAVMTLHRAKGTEFSRVLLFGVSKDAIPKFFAGSAFDEQAEQETALRERSLLYVGATRARDLLAISWNKQASPYLPVS